MGWVNRLLNLVRADEFSRGLNEELDFHIDARTRDNLAAGMSLDAARQDARRRFGNQTLAKERTREMDIMASIETIGQDLRYAVRGLLRSPGFTSVAVLALALGIGANTAVFTVVNGVLLRPLPFPEPGRLILISSKPRDMPFLTKPVLSDRDYIEFLRQNQSFERIATFGETPITLTGFGDAVRLPAAAVTPSLFPVLRVNPSIGRAFLAEEDQPGRDAVVLLSDKIWRGRFGADASILGKTITLDGVGHKVIGILPASFNFPPSAELWLPLAVRNDMHNISFRPALGRLKPGVSAKQALAELDTFVSRRPIEPGERKSEMITEILPLKDLLAGNIRKLLLVFAGAVAFVLLIACANVANLLLIRSATRQQEMSVRAALGARRGRLIRQVLTESTLLSLCGGAAGMLLAVVGVPALLALAPAGKIPRTEEIHIDSWVFAFTFGVAVLTGILFGLAPAFQSSGLALRESLSQGGRGIAGCHGGLRAVLVVSEIALTLVLLIGAGLMLKSFLRMRSVDPGFRPENVLTMTVDLPDSANLTAAGMRTFHERMLEKLSSVPGVVAAGAVNWLPLKEFQVMGDFHIEGGRKLPPHYTVFKPAVNPRYFDVMRIRLLSGRFFTGHDTTNASGVAIISHSVARILWPGEDPLGKRITLEDDPQPQDWLTIVGVVEDVRESGLTKDPDPAIYQPYLQVTRAFFLSHMTFAVRTAVDPRSMAGAMRDALHEIDKNQPAQSISTMQDVIATTTEEPWFQTRLISIFSLLALLLAAIGIYGVLAYSVTERTREIGIRMALGAAKADVLGMVLHRTLGLAVAGVILGTCAALAVTRVLAKFLFDVKPTDPATFVAVAGLLAAVALLAGLLPARRAIKVDPVVALRWE